MDNERKDCADYLECSEEELDELTSWSFSVVKRFGSDISNSQELEKVIFDYAFSHQLTTKQLIYTCMKLGAIVETLNPSPQLVLAKLAIIARRELENDKNI